MKEQKNQSQQRLKSLPLVYSSHRHSTFLIARNKIDWNYPVSFKNSNFTLYFQSIYPFLTLNRYMTTAVCDQTQIQPTSSYFPPVVPIPMATLKES